MSIPESTRRNAVWAGVALGAVLFALLSALGFGGVTSYDSGPDGE